MQVVRILLGRTDVITAEVAQHIGHNTVGAICMQPTDGLVRGSPVVNTGSPASTVA